MGTAMLDVGRGPALAPQGRVVVHLPLGSLWSPLPPLPPTMHLLSFPLAAPCTKPGTRCCGSPRTCPPPADFQSPIKRCRTYPCPWQQDLWAGHGPDCLERSACLACRPFSLSCVLELTWSSLSTCLPRFSQSMPFLGLMANVIPQPDSRWLCFFALPVTRRPMLGRKIGK